MNQVFSTELYKQAEKLFGNYPRKVNALLPLLHMVQKEKGFIDGESMKEVAKLCDVAVSHVQGVVTFYTMYTQNPRGKCKISVCTNISCYIRGAAEILEHLEETLGVTPGHSTEDGQFFLEEVECLGACGYAPVMLVDEKYHEKIDLNLVDKIVKENRLENA